MLLAALMLSHAITTPIDFGRAALAEIAGDRANDVKVEIRRGGIPESFAIRGAGGSVTIAAPDQTGAMYGLLEFAERLKREGGEAWHEKIDERPFLPERGLNLFLTLPWDYAKNDTDYDVAALTDPNRWWFQNDDYWQTLLDLMAKSRLNWLDIHGAWDISVTDAPNLYAYFVNSRSFPKVGVPEEVKEANLARLNKVIEMAHARGIKVSLMSYQASLSIPQNRKPPYGETTANEFDYTKEAVEEMIRKAPGLDALGFRIGESGKDASFFNCYLQAVKNSGRDMPLITRSWVTTRRQVLPLARASKDFTIEIKYNGEQWIAPYPIVGGRMANWGSYSFEDYLSDAGLPEKNAKTWPGWPADEGSWPGEPYKIVWQVRANGTHRIFPFYNPDWVRRSIKAMKMGTVSGYTVEGEDAYFPKSPQYYLANPRDQYVNWIHQRDELYWMCWGRLGYDPKTPDSVFDDVVADWFGASGKAVAESWKKASEIVPLAALAYSLGPDHRDHAPELETGGDMQAFIDGQPFDPLVYASPAESVVMTGAPRTLGEQGQDLLKRVVDLRRRLGEIDVRSIPESSLGRFKELQSAMSMLGDLGSYYGNRFIAAQQGAETGFYNLEDDSQATFVDRSISSWAALSANEYYRPFTDRLRMHTNRYAWSSMLAGLKKEAGRFSTREHVPTGSAGFQPPHLSYRWVGNHVQCTLRSPGAGIGNLLYKPLPSSTFFHSIPMERRGQDLVATVDAPRCGLCLAARTSSRGGSAPDFFSGETPYLVVPARPGPTPQIYSTAEALTYLSPEILSPQRYAAILVASRGWDFFRTFDRRTQRKLLAPVSNGLDLFILQQDYVSGRYPLGFLPKPLTVENNPSPDHFTPGGALGLPELTVPGILWQRFVPSPDWDVYGNGGVARLRYGNGSIWMINARLLQDIGRQGDGGSHPVAAALKGLMRKIAGQSGKPVVIIDPGTEGAVDATSFYPDLLNSMGISFLTLGEAIAADQGMDSSKPIPGPTMPDEVLHGQGSKMADAFLRNQVQSWSHKTTPAARAEFEAIRQRRRRELLRTLGLDPMPPRTALNARVTGVVQREGFHIDKVVIESRPRFYVTCHVYVPDGEHGRLPVIVHVNGHWAHKKDEDRVQLRCAFSALQGYLAIAVDSPGFSFEGNSLIERRAEGDHNDYTLVEGGANATGYYVWDTIRALDYIATRGDADMSRVGITGASGGGLATLYAFAADERYKAAVPVVYMSSMELAPDNGCLCNHVPGTCQIGDRSDVIAIQAPKPVFIMGAQDDGEFPPDAMNLTRQKMAETWALFGKANDTYVRIYPGPHDYSQAMRESMIGFFNKYLKGEGDGSPVAQPHLSAINSEDRQLLVLDPPIAGERTMRDLSRERLDGAATDVTARQAIAVNGGSPRKGDLKYKEKPKDALTSFVTFESEPGLVSPGVLVAPSTGHSPSLTIFVDDRGKAAVLGLKALPGLYLDILGTGELSQIEMRYSVYLGRSVAFTGGWQIVRAAEAMRKYGEIRIHAKGPISTQAAMWAGLMDHDIAGIDAEDCLSEWQDVFQPGVSDYAVQPRANLCGSLAHLRSLIPHSTWKMAPR